MTTLTSPTTHTLAADGATLTYDVRGAESSEPALFLIGSPMGAGGFVTLASHFTDRTVVTYDPRGVERSTKDDPATESTPEQHADDLHRIIEALGSGPGRPVRQQRRRRQRTRTRRCASGRRPHARGARAPARGTRPGPRGRAGRLACRRRTHTGQGGFGAGMARFIGVVSHQGPFTLEEAAAPGPDPAMFGLPAEDDGNRTDPLLFQNLVTSTHYEPAFDVLRAAPTRIVLAAGVESAGQLAHRGAEAAAERLGQEAVAFPSDHGGFLGGEYGQAGDPDAFAARLREVLAGA